MTNADERQHELGRLLKQIRSTYSEGLRPWGKRIGLSPSYISKLELGQVPVPRRATLETIADRLNLDPVPLLTAAGYVPYASSTRGAEATLSILLSQLDDDQVAALIAYAKHIRDEDIAKRVSR